MKLKPVQKNIKARINLNHNILYNSWYMQKPLGEYVYQENTYKNDEWDVPWYTVP